LFFIYIFYKIPQMFFQLLIEYPKLFLTTVGKVNAALSIGEWIEALTAAKEILTPTFILGILVFFIYRMGKPLFNRLFKRFFQQA